MTKEKKTEEIKSEEEKDVDEIIDTTSEANKTIQNHVIASIGVGLIPMPVIDILGLTGVQLNMLRKLAKIYEVPFSEHRITNILGSLVGGSVAVPVAGALASLFKIVPLVGQTVGAVSLPVIAGATTYAVGKVFLQHFASGGTFLSFDPDKVRDYYNEMFEQGKEISSEIKSKK